MTTAALARIEVRHVARSPLLWLGMVLAAAFAGMELPEREQSQRL
jgi:hypothetical protein